MSSENPLSAPPPEQNPVESLVDESGDVEKNPVTEGAETEVPVTPESTDAMPDATEQVQQEISLPDLPEETPAETQPAPEDIAPPEHNVEIPEPVLQEQQTETAPEQATDPLDVGRERVRRFGSFLSRMKDGFVNKIKSSGGRITGALSKAATIAGKAGLAVLSADELVKRGAERTIEFTQDAYDSARRKVAEIKSAAVTGIENGIDYVRTKAEDTMDYGRLSLARATARITNPLVNFQAKMFDYRFQHLSDRMERGKPISPEDIALIKSKIDLLKAVVAIHS